MHKFEMRNRIEAVDIIIFAIMIIIAMFTLISFTDIAATYPVRTTQNDGPYFNYYHDKVRLIIRAFEFILCRIFIVTMIFFMTKYEFKKTMIFILLFLPSLIIGLLSWFELGYDSTIKDVGPTDSIFQIFPIHTLALFIYPVWKFNYYKKKKFDIFIKIAISVVIIIGVVFCYNLVKFQWRLS